MSHFVMYFLLCYSNTSYDWLQSRLVIDTTHGSSQFSSILARFPICVNRCSMKVMKLLTQTSSLWSLLTICIYWVNVLPDFWLKISNLSSVINVCPLSRVLNVRWINWSVLPILLSVNVLIWQPIQWQLANNLTYHYNPHAIGFVLNLFYIYLKTIYIV